LTERATFCAKNPGAYRETSGNAEKKQRMEVKEDRKTDGGILASFPVQPGRGEKVHKRREKQKNSTSG